LRLFYYNIFYQFSPYLRSFHILLSFLSLWLISFFFPPNGISPFSSFRGGNFPICLDNSK
jgi:hypothetical protein